MGCERRNLPAGGQYNVSERRGGAREQLFPDAVETHAPLRARARERESPSVRRRERFPTRRKKERRRGTSTFRFCVSRVTRDFARRVDGPKRRDGASRNCRLYENCSPSIESGTDEWTVVVVVAVSNPLPRAYARARK